MIEPKTLTDEPWYRPAGVGGDPADWPQEARAEVRTGFPSEQRTIGTIAPGFLIYRPTRSVPAARPLPQRAVTRPAPEPVDVEIEPEPEPDPRLGIAAYAVFRIREGRSVLELDDAAYSFLPEGALRISSHWVGKERRILVRRNLTLEARRLVGEPPRGVPIEHLISERRRHGLRIGDRFVVLPEGRNQLVVDVAIALPSTTGGR